MEHPTGDVATLAETIRDSLNSLLGGTVAQQPRERASPYRRVHVVINPSAGQNRPILQTLNAVFGATGIDWGVSITKRSGDAREQARQAAMSGADVVAAYGGDGTVMEVASGLIGSGVPMAIFPGGTGNVLSIDLGIPRSLVAAAALVCGAPSSVRPVDMGRVGERHFILRAGIGLEAEMMRSAPPEMKDVLGPLAYAVSALQNLSSPHPSRYHLTLDGQQVEVEGLVCTIANSANTGMGGISLVPKIDLADGLFDVVVVRRADLAEIAAILAQNLAPEAAVEPLPHWHAREVTVEADPPQTVVLDGEEIGQTPVSAQVIPSAARIVVPGA